ncbi:MAG: YdcF family protein, partial [Rubrivivax sp.]|nr:YdcF family protein [Rubrivivax sp.]
TGPCQRPAFPGPYASSKRNNMTHASSRVAALRSVALLEPQGIEQIVLVTHGYHMPRALRNFQRAAEGRKITMVAAPMGMSPTGRLRASDWLPTAAGFADTRLVLHEWIGRLMGA